MSNQTGFGFGADRNRPVFMEQPPGTWETRRDYTTDEYNEIFAKAGRVLVTLPDTLQPVFGRALAEAQTEHASMLKACERGGASYSMWRVSFSGDAGMRGAFFAMCRLAGQCEGATIKVRQEHGSVSAGMYIEGLGSVVLFIADNGNHCFDYTVDRDPFFLDSYRDNQPAYEVPYATWGDSYCADKISCSSHAPANVRSFLYRKREYINTGGCYHGDYRDCQGWTICPLESWVGPTYTYASHGDAREQGRVERGDYRGIVVKVRGRLCVIESAATFFDLDAGRAERLAESAKRKRAHGDALGTAAAA